MDGRPPCGGRPTIFTRVPDNTSKTPYLKTSSVGQPHLGPDSETTFAFVTTPRLGRPPSAGQGED